MIKTVEIEDALARINGDIFQEFCNHFLYLKLNPNSITPIGSVIGKEKSRKGIPDSYFVSSDNKLIFAEYTTQERLKTSERFYSKLVSDVENCFNTAKTGLNKNEIDVVILCFTNRVDPGERKNLEGLCRKHNPKCSLLLFGIRDLAFAVLDYPTLGSYIGVQIGTGQIQEPSVFIANYERNKISTPLSNSFLGRGNEIKDGFDYLDNNDILLVHGAAGTGKSKYAIELAKLYSDKNNFTFLCIGNKGIPIWEDIKSSIRSNENYALLVDDANRLAKNFQWILSLLENRATNTLKIIVTVRDYALRQIKTVANNYDYSTIEINPLSDDEIKKIIQSDDFKINNPAYIDRILKISQGNARLAIMSARVAAKTNNLLELNDASHIYDEYFRPLFDEIQLLKDPVTLKALAIISFFSRIDKAHRELCDHIFGNVDIDENRFWEICYSLHESELVDLFEQQIVKVSDQIFATYIFYKAVIEKKILSFSFFLDDYLKYERRIGDTIIPVINTFSYKQVEKTIKPVILAKWVEIEKQGNHQDSLMFLDLFWFYLSPQILSFLKRHVDKQTPERLTEYRYRYELNEFSCHGVGKELKILSKFKYHEERFFRDALELMFYYTLKIPSKMPAIIYIIKEKFCFSRFGYTYGDYVQHILFDFLIEKAKSSSNKNVYEDVLSEILPDFLKIEFREDEGNGRCITMYTFHLCLSDSIKSFRAKCFNFLLSSAKKSTILHVLYRLNFYEYKRTDNKILQYDKNFIFQIINKHFDFDQFEDCVVLQNVLDGLDRLRVDYSKEINVEYKSKSYQLADALKLDKQRKKELGWEEEEKLHQKKLLGYCNGFDINKYKSLFSNVSKILEWIKETRNDNTVWQYENSLNIILGNLAMNNKSLFLEAMSLILKEFKFNLHYHYTFNCFLQTTPMSYNDLYEIVKDSELSIKFNYHQTLNIDSVKTEHLYLLYFDLLDSIKQLPSQYTFSNLKFVSKYQKIINEKDIYHEIIEIVLAKAKEEGIKISVGFHFIERCIAFDNFPLEKIVAIYLQSHDIDSHFDYEKKIFLSLLQKDKNFVIQFLKFKSSQKIISFYDLEHENLDCLWELDNCPEIITTVIEYLINSETCCSPERAVSAFFPQSQEKYGNRPTDYLAFLIDEKYLDGACMDIVFSIVNSKFPELKQEYLKRFLMLNSNLKDFENLEITPRYRSWSGSYIPILEEEKRIWENVIVVLDSFPNRLDYYEHKEYANEQIGYREIRIKKEMENEFYEDF